VALEKQYCESSNQAGKLLAVVLALHLRAGEKVAWFVSGGSSIPIAHDAIRLLDNTDNLRVLIVDDKYRDEDGIGINQAILQNEKLPSGTELLLPSYTGSLSVDTERYDTKVNECIIWADCSIGQFGIGEGYHTGGILPGARNIIESANFVAGYQVEGQVSITITPKCVRRLNVIFVNSFGESKRELVQHFLKSKETVINEPTQILKEAQRTILVSDMLH
jgi:6-phosphogluconolactonase/glucosamine-6-phosphate isomerase/deaminase